MKDKIFRATIFCARNSGQTADSVVAILKAAIEEGSYKIEVKNVTPTLKEAEQKGYLRGLEKALSFMLGYHDTIDGHEINYQTIRKIKNEIEKAKRDSNGI